MRYLFPLLIFVFINGCKSDQQQPADTYNKGIIHISCDESFKPVIDAVLKGKSLGPNVVAAQSSEGVIDYVSKTDNAVGFIGFSWIGNQDDPAQVAYTQKVRVAYLESTDSANAYVKPSQFLIYTKT